MSTPRQREILLGEDGGLAINVARCATSPTSVEAPVPEVDNQIIDNAAPKITASYSGKSEILRENADLDTCRWSTASGKRPRTDPLLGWGSVQENTALLINCIQPTAVFIKIRIGAHEQKCLVDRGATVSLISR